MFILPRCLAPVIPINIAGKSDSMYGTKSIFIASPGKAHLRTAYGRFSSTGSWTFMNCLWAKTCKNPGTLGTQFIAGSWMVLPPKIMSDNRFWPIPNYVTMSAFKISDCPAACGMVSISSRNPLLAENRTSTTGRKTGPRLPIPSKLNN